MQYSAAQWPTLGIYGAEQCPFFADVPDWVWAADHPDDPYGTGLRSWLDASQTMTGTHQGAFGYTGRGYSNTLTPAGVTMLFSAKVPLADVAGSYTFDPIVPSPYAWLAENIAMGYSSPEQVMSGWMSSPGHRANILNGSYTHIGVGVCDGCGTHWTQNFGTRSGGGGSTPPTGGGGGGKG